MVVYVGGAKVVANLVSSGNGKFADTAAGSKLDAWLDFWLVTSKQFAGGLPFINTNKPGGSSLSSSHQIYISKRRRTFLTGPQLPYVGQVPIISN
jgi:hypothetical protein